MILNKVDVFFSPKYQKVLVLVLMSKLWSCNIFSNWNWSKIMTEITDRNDCPLYKCIRLID